MYFFNEIDGGSYVLIGGRKSYFRDVEYSQADRTFKGTVRMDTIENLRIRGGFKLPVETEDDGTGEAPPTAPGNLSQEELDAAEAAALAANVGSVAAAADTADDSAPPLNLPKLIKIIADLTFSADFKSIESGTLEQFFDDESTAVLE